MARCLTDRIDSFSLSFTNLHWVDWANNIASVDNGRTSSELGLLSLLGNLAIAMRVLVTFGMMCVVLEDYVCPAMMCWVENVFSFCWLGPGQLIRLQR